MLITSRPEIASRATTVWPMYSVQYSQAGPRPGSGLYRADCSGFVSNVIGLPPPGRDTITLVTQGWCVEIPESLAERGDIWGRMGVGTGGNLGHTAILVGTKATSGQWVVIDQPGGTPGPKRRIFTTIPTGYKFYRSVATITPGGVAEMLCKFTDKGLNVAALQNLIVASGGSLPAFGADGDYGQETATALAALIGGDGKTYGPAQWAALFNVHAKKYASAPGPVPPHKHGFSGTTEVA